MLVRSADTDGIEDWTAQREWNRSVNERIGKSEVDVKELREMHKHSKMDVKELRGIMEILVKKMNFDE